MAEGDAEARAVELARERRAIRALEIAVDDHRCGISRTPDVVLEG
jgi:hypothetical protein